MSKFHMAAGTNYCAALIDNNYQGIVKSKDFGIRDMMEFSARNLVEGSPDYPAKYYRDRVLSNMFFKNGWYEQIET